MRHGKFWMVQVYLDWWISFGVHVDLKTRLLSSGLKYGPYVDLHIGCVILSFGRNPVYSGDFERAISVSRGGIEA
jgi:hypothetical protein